jgi:hypothetical protein
MFGTAQDQAPLDATAMANKSSPVVLSIAAAAAPLAISLASIVRPGRPPGERLACLTTW